WCSELLAKNATAEQVLSLGVTNLRQGDGWKKLAHMPLCTDCHARLDYGWQFFTGTPDITFGQLSYVPSLHPESGPLYVRDADDSRGEGPLTPLGFAKLATQQPEFE